MGYNGAGKDVWLLCVLMMAWSLLASCGNGEKESDENSANDALLSTIAVSEGFLEEELVLNGDIAYDENKVSKVYIPCSGKIQGVKVEMGDYVASGQLLASVYSQDAAEYGKQMSDILSEIKLANRELSLKKDLHQSGMASDKEVEEAQSRVDMALSEKERLEAVAHVNGYAASSIASITAPMSGYLFAKSVYNGSYIDDTNNDTPAFEIANLESVWVVADVYESDIKHIALGEKVYITVLAYPEMRWEGHINKLYPNLDSESKTMKVRVNLDNKEKKLLPGMFANVYVSLSGSGKKMMQVPSKCIVFENGNNYVVAVDNQGKYYRQKVKVAHQDETSAYIENGVKIGEQVVCENALLVFSNLR